MLVDPHKPPAFCKLLLSRETFMTKIQVPSHFVKENKKMLTKGCLLKTDDIAIPWEAKMLRENSNYFICEGDWPKFVVHHQLKHGDLLLFFLVEKSTFHVQPYTRKYCRNIPERQLFYEELSSSSSEEENGPSLKKSKRTKKVDPIIEVPDTEEESVDTSSKHGDAPPYSSHRAIYYKNPKREKASSSEDDDEESESESEADGPKNNRRWNRQWSVVNFKGDNPYYEIVVRKSHATFMTIPMRFARRTGIIDMKKMRLVSEKGKEEWKVEIVHIGARVIIKRGWTEFRIHNKIANGETCRFKLIQGQGYATSNVLHVQKIPTPPSLQYY